MSTPKRLRFLFLLPLVLVIGFLLAMPYQAGRLAAEVVLFFDRLI